MALATLAALAASLGGAMYLLRPTASPVLATVHLPSFPSQVVADAQAGRMLVLSNYDSPGPIGSTWSGGSVRLLDASDGRQLQVLRMGVPLTAIVDPRTGWAFVVSSGAPSGRGSSRGIYLQVIDPARGALVRTLTLAAPAALVAPRSFRVPPPAAAAAPAIPVARADPPQPSDPDSPARRTARAGVRIGVAAGRTATRRGTASAGGQSPGLETSPSRAALPDATVVGIPMPTTVPALPHGTPQLLGTNAGGFHRPRGSPVPAANGAGFSAGASGVGLAIDDPLRRVFVLSNATPGPGYSSRLSVIDAAGGALLRPVSLSFAAAALAIDGRSGRLFIADVTGQSVLVYDARTLRMLVSVPIGCSPAQMTIDEAAGRVYALCIGPMRSMVVTLDSSNGQRLNGAIIGANGMQLLVDSARGRVYAVSAGSFLGGRLGSARIAILDAHSGVPLHAVDVGPIIPQVALEPLHGHLYVAGTDARTNRGVLLVLDAATGSVRARIAIGRGSTDLAVAARQNRLFVAGASGLVPEAGRWSALVDRVRSFFGQQIGPAGLSGPGFDGPGGAITVIDTRL